MLKQRWLKITLSCLSAVIVLFGIFSLYVTQIEGRSVQSKLTEMRLDAQGRKEAFADKEKLAEHMDKESIQNEKPYVIPEDVKLSSTIQKENVSGMEIFLLSRKGGKSEKQILYLHGGSYVNQPDKSHWEFLDKVAEDTNTVITVPLYPKAPVHQYQEAFDKVLPIYENLLQKTNPENIVIMGDSAGGGFSLALSQVLLEKKLPQPGNIILISPWLDITMKNPEIPALESKDPMLGSYGLVQMGKSWAGETDPDYYMLSPINGPIKGLGNITLFVGTHELFLPDARKFRDIAEEQGVAINYFEYEKMNHVFPLYPIPEAEKARKEIINIINKSN